MVLEEFGSVFWVRGKMPSKKGDDYMGYYVDNDGCNFWSSETFGQYFGHGKVFSCSRFCNEFRCVNQS